MSCPNCRAPFDKDLVKELQRPLGLLDVLVLLPLVFLFYLAQSIYEYSIMSINKIKSLGVNCYQYFITWVTIKLPVLFVTYYHYIRTRSSQFFTTLKINLVFSMKILWVKLQLLSLKLLEISKNILQQTVHNGKLLYQFGVKVRILKEISWNFFDIFL